MLPPMGSYGGLEILIGLVVFLGIPVWTLRYVARSRGQSERFVLWGLLSYLGLVIGILVMIATPQAQQRS